MHIDCSKSADFASWLSLAREVEPLFGPMADESGFQDALKAAISSKTAFCIYSDSDEGEESILGGIIISKQTNEIAWLAVSEKYRSNGYGRRLMEFALNKLNQRESIFVQTFDESVCEGVPARKLYLELGFTDFQDGGLNPAGVSTVIMHLEAS